MDFGLIGSNTSLSRSGLIHKEISGINYELISLSSQDEVKEFLKSDFKGINVTIPYKELVCSLCDELSVNSKALGVVNTVIKRNNKLYGYNTDIDGFEYLLKINNILVKDKSVLILGTGATSKTVKFVMTKLGAKEIKFISSHKSNNPDVYSYFDFDVVKQADIIVNATPLKDACLIDFSSCKHLEYMIDLNYYPYRTTYLALAKQNGIKVINGYQMLVSQALKADELFLDKKFDESKIEDICKKLFLLNENIVISGHPYSGKSTIGKALATNLDKEFLDLDQLIEEKSGYSIKDIFSKGGEEAFRKIEHETLVDVVSNKSNIVLSLGGGTLIQKNNVNDILSFGPVVNLCRDLSMIKVYENRPLINDIEALKTLVKDREETYKNLSDITIENNSTIDECVKRIEEKL